MELVAPVAIVAIAVVEWRMMTADRIEHGLVDDVGMRVVTHAAAMIEGKLRTQVALQCQYFPFPSPCRWVSAIDWPNAE